MAVPLKRLWCEKKTLRLIKEIKSRPCIWNTEHEDYNEKYSLATSWEEIATAMEMSESNVRMKWKNLRDTYRKELKKSHEGHRSPWTYFHKLSFIMWKAKGKNKLTEKIDDETESETQYKVQFESIGQTEEIYWGEEDPIPDKNIKEEEDDFDVMFLKSLTPYLRKLGPMRRLVARKLDVKNKWKTLRDTYRKELKKTGNGYTSRWQYFDKLSFVEFKTTENEPAEKSDDDTENQQEYEVQLDTLRQNEEIYWGEEDPIPDKRIKEEKDDFDVMFLKSLTPYLRELGPMRRLVVRSKLQDMLLNELAAQNASRRTSNS